MAFVVFLTLTCILSEPCPVAAQENGKEWQADLGYAISSIVINYAWFDQSNLDPIQLRKKYFQELANVRNRNDFFRLLEQLVDELHDHHAHLNQNNQQSFRLVPSGLDIWIEYVDGQYLIDDVRGSTQAAESGIGPGDVVSRINGIEIDDLVEKRLQFSSTGISSVTKSWAARTLVAGRQHQSSINLTIVDTSGGTRVIDWATGRTDSNASLLTYRKLKEGIHYVRIENSLGEGRLVEEFDRVVDELESNSKLILDLRDTPGGGSSDVARGLMGRLVSKEMSYQKHEFLEKPLNIPRIWLERVRPRGKSQLSGDIVVLCGRWTGSMGEGITVGLDAMQRATTVGSPMAGLRGATRRFDLPNSGIGIYLPVEKLFHVDGTPRENYVPRIRIPTNYSGNVDECLEAATRLLNK